MIGPGLTMHSPPLSEFAAMISVRNVLLKGARGIAQPIPLPNSLFLPILNCDSYLKVTVAEIPALLAVRPDIDPDPGNALRSV